MQSLKVALAGSTVDNLAVDGETTDGLVARFEAELKPRLSSDESNVVIIAIGVNDSAWIEAEKHCWVPLDQFKTNLVNLITAAKRHNWEIILVGPASVDQTKVDPVPWRPELGYKTELVRQYSQVMGKIAEQEKLKFVDLFNQLPEDYLQTLDDGLHPNTLGHQLIFNLVKNVLK